MEISQKILDEISLEMQRATKKHPKWSSDYVKRAAYVAEEAGELLQAANNFDLDGEGLDKVRKEAIETIVVALRFVKEMEDDFEMCFIKYGTIEIERCPLWRLKSTLKEFYQFPEKFFPPNMDIPKSAMEFVYVIFPDGTQKDFFECLIK